MSFKTTSFCASALILLGAPVWAHVTLEQAQVASGSTYKAVLRVPHGCEGLPTTVIRVELPAGFQGAKPMPKAGWTTQTKLQKLAQPYDSHGKQVTEDVTEVSWAVKAPEFALRDHEYDEFIVRGTVAMPAGAAWFKVSQLCEDGAKTGSNRWTQTPTSGTSTLGLKYPAALLNVTSASNTPVSSTGASSAPTGHPHSGHKH